MIIIGFVIHKNVSTSEPFAQDLVPILDISKSLADYICQVALAALPSLVYYKNYIKAAHIGGGFSVLHLLSLRIAHKNIFLTGDTRREINVTIDDAEVIRATSLNGISMLMYNSKAKE